MKVQSRVMGRIASIVGGSALLGLSAFWPWPARWRALSALGGMYLLARGISGREPVHRLLGIARRERRGIEVVETVTIGRPKAEVYTFWRNFENLPLVMEHLEEVQVIDGAHSRWRARAPLRASAEWEAEITEDRPNELIAWRSLPGSQVQTDGIVRFADAPGGLGTEVQVSLTYLPPLGAAGAAFARLFGEEPALQVRDDLRRLKRILETGEVPSMLGQSSGRVRQVRRERSRIGGDGRRPAGREANR